jgi:uncharacterized ParB-like nuclease family protein
MLDMLTVHQAAKSNYGHIGEDAAERQNATHRFERALRKAWGRAVIAKFTGRSRHLLNMAAFGTHEGRFLGLQTVSLCQIRGSENRTHDFDIDFLPIREHIDQRWIGLAAAVLRDVRMPPVELLRSTVNGRTVYFVRDGHHRISVARALGQMDIEALVTEWE